MDLFEYQARDLFEKHGVPVLRAQVADTPEQAQAAAEALGVSSSEWDTEAYADYLKAVTDVRDEWDASAPLDAVEYALSRS